MIEGSLIQLEGDSSVLSDSSWCYAKYLAATSHNSAGRGRYF